MDLAHLLPDEMRLSIVREIMRCGGQQLGIEIVAILAILGPDRSARTTNGRMNTNHIIWESQIPVSHTVL